MAFKHTAFLIAALLGGLWAGQAQTDLSQSQTLNIGADSPLPIEDPNMPNTASRIKMPAMDNTAPSSVLDEKPEIKMLPDRELLRAGHDLKIDPKVGDYEKPGAASKHFGDMYLGDVKTGAKFVGIVCRDHEFVDGDRVRILVNDQVVEPNILLTGSFKGINLDLEKGFNRVDFEALNMGSSGPNTAEVNVYDDKGQLIYANKWNLSTGSKASLIIVKDE